MKKLSLFFLVFLLLGIAILPSTSLAKGNIPTDGVLSNNPTYGEGSTNTEFSIESTQYFKEGTNYIKLVSSNIVTVGGETKAYSPVDKILVDLFLQRWDAANSRWVDVIHVGEYVQYNSSYVSGAKSVTVTKGYYYRTRSYHSVLEGGILEQANVYSTYIYVP